MSTAVLALKDVLKFPFNQFSQRVGKASIEPYFKHEKEFPFNQFSQRVGKVVTETINLPDVLFPFNQFSQRVGKSRSFRAEHERSCHVSIQLVFPASGKGLIFSGFMILVSGFHSISFPSEWESKHELVPVGTEEMFPFNQFSQRVGKLDSYEMTSKSFSRFHSISFPSEWESPDNVFRRQMCRSFHSISFPSEWERPCLGWS